LTAEQILRKKPLSLENPRDSKKLSGAPASVCNSLSVLLDFLAQIPIKSIARASQGFFTAVSTVAPQKPEFIQ
jgi:hypothetical protein